MGAGSRNAVRRAARVDVASWILGSSEYLAADGARMTRALERRRDRLGEAADWSVAVARSAERTGFYLRAGFLF